MRRAKSPALTLPGSTSPMLISFTQVQTTARYAHLASDTVKASGSRIDTRSTQCPVLSLPVRRDFNQDNALTVQNLDV